MESVNNKKDRTRLLHGILAITLGLIIAFAVFVDTNTVEDSPSVCYFNTMTGLPCPGCGITRSVSAAGNGHFEAAWTYHPFGIGVLFALVTLFITESLYSIVPVKITKRLLSLSYKLSIAIYAGLILYGIIRLVMTILS